MDRTGKTDKIDKIDKTNRTDKTDKTDKKENISSQNISSLFLLLWASLLMVTSFTGSIAAEERQHNMASLSNPASNPKSQANSAFASTPEAVSESGDRLRIFLLTIEPGLPLYTKWGHTALYIHDPSNRQSIVFDYGLFHLDHRFVLRYFRQEPSFMLGTSPFQKHFDRYSRQNRNIYSQEFFLEPAAAARLLERLQTNLQPENRHYNYHNYVDNCTTRVRDLLNEALGNRLQPYFQEQPANINFRRASTNYLLSTPFYWYFLNLLVGPKIDLPINTWEWMFLPDTLMLSLEMYRQAYPFSGIGPIQELVKAPPAPPVNLALRWSLFIGCFLLFVVLFFVLPLLKPEQALWRFVGYLGWFLWNSLSALLGIAIAFLWFIVGWDYCQNNYNILAFSPLALLLLPFGLMLQRAKYANISLFIHAGFVALPLVGSLLLLAGLQQDSLFYMLPALSIQVLIFARLYRSFKMM